MGGVMPMLSSLNGVEAGAGWPPPYRKLLQFLREGREVPPPHEYEFGTPLSFFRLQEGEMPRENGCAMLCCEPDRLHAYALFSDRDIYNDAEHDNDHTWEKGDTFELFFQIRGREDYYELHTTPPGYTLQLHVRNYRTFRRTPFEQQLVEGLIAGESEIDRERNLWLAGIVLPFAAIGLTPELLSGSRFSFARFNRNRGTEIPEISLLRPFQVTSHCPPNWLVIR